MKTINLELKESKSIKCMKQKNKRQKRKDILVMISVLLFIKIPVSPQIPKYKHVAILSVILTFMFLVLLSYYPKGQGLSAIVVGGSLMFLMGLIDDVFTLNAKSIKSSAFLSILNPF